MIIPLIMSEIDENVLVTGCEQALASFAPEISEVLIPHNPNLQNWMGPSESSRTAPNLTAGIQSLQNLARNMTSNSLGWKLFENLEKEGIGTRELEKQAVKRKQEREQKKGTKKKERNFCETEKDQKHLEKLIEIRKHETKDDWEELREQFRKKKESLKSEAKSSKERNYLAKELKKIHEGVRSQFNAGKEKHERKIGHLKAKLKPSPKKIKRTKVKSWLEAIAEGNPGEYQPPLFQSMVTSQLQSKKKQ